MSWQMWSFVPMLMWGGYLVLASKAIALHGERVTMVFEAGAMVLVALWMVTTSGVGDFSRVTRLSLAFVIGMALLSAVGLAIQFYAFSIAPRDKQGMVGMINGLFPVVGCLLFAALPRLGIEGGAPMTSRQWLGLATGILTLWLVSGSENTPSR